MSAEVYELLSRRARKLRFHYRKGTSDIDIINNTLVHDEYGLNGRKFEGFAIDVGAHIGSVSIPLALDNPGLTVIAVEPVPENAALLRQNTEENGVGSRVVLVQHALHTPVVDYGWSGRNSWVGNLGEGKPSKTATCGQMTLESLMTAFDVIEPVLLKLDCEGYEWPVLGEKCIARCPLIVGEFHDEDNKAGVARLHELLDETHKVTTKEWTFTATRKD